MSPKQSWYEWLDGWVARYATARECAAFFGVDESTLSRWRRRPLQEPQTTDLEALAAKTKTPLAELLLMVFTAVKERNALRARPPRGRSRGQRKLAALLLGLTSGVAAGTPLPAVAKSLITNTTQVSTDSRDSVAWRRKRAA